jgi:hypothetical protein
MLSFCGINAHWQNGVAEKCIHDLTELAQTMLIHANWHWPSAVNHYLWPYTLWHANAVINSTPSLVKDRNDHSPEQMFSKSTVNIDIKNWVPFGCPTYCLDNALQNQRK